MGLPYEGDPLIMHTMVSYANSFTEMVLLTPSRNIATKVGSAVVVSDPSYPQVDGQTLPNLRYAQCEGNIVMNCLSGYFESFSLHGQTAHSEFLYGLRDFMCGTRRSEFAFYHLACHFATATSMETVIALAEGSVVPAARL